MLTRTIISLERSQLRALKARARAQGVSVAEFMRRIVADYLNDQRPPTSVPRSTFEGMVAIGSSGRADVSERHDALLADAIGREHDR